MSHKMFNSLPSSLGGLDWCTSLCWNASSLMFPGYWAFWVKSCAFLTWPCQILVYIPAAKKLRVSERIPQGLTHRSIVQGHCAQSIPKKWKTFHPIWSCCARPSCVHCRLAIAKPNYWAECYSLGFCSLLKITLLVLCKINKHIFTIHNSIIYITFNDFIILIYYYYNIILNYYNIQCIIYYNIIVQLWRSMLRYFTINHVQLLLLLGE